MELLKVFKKQSAKLLRLPSGSFTVDRQGAVLVRTVPSTFPQHLIEQIGQIVLEVFRDASSAQVALSQITVTYPNLRIAARELRGGAMIFLSARDSLAPQTKKQ
jgi:hypothetical protein